MSQGFGCSVLPPQQIREAKILERSVLRHFQSISDPREISRNTYPLISIITIAILAVISGADGCVAIETYGKAKQSWLETFLDLPGGIPSHDTFGRVLAALDPKELENGFLNWIKTITEKLDIKLIHIDGKEHNGSYDRKEKLKSLHSVSAWSSEYGLSLAQEKVDSKSNEIKAVPLLLNLLDLRGATVTLDAMGTQFAIAQQIRLAGGNYNLALKGNQGKLSKQVEKWFKEAEAQNWQGIEYSYHEAFDTGHYRTEARQVWSVSVNQLPPLHRQEIWHGLSTVIMVKSTRVLWNKTTTAVRFYISSLEPDAERDSHIIRSHWSVENSCHWVLDVVFNEDASRIRKGNGAQNFGTLRRLSLNLLKKEPSKQSLKMKRYRAGISNDFLMEILAASEMKAKA
jgi:predicted transposase YbfD/YdcC